MACPWEPGVPPTTMPNSTPRLLPPRQDLLSEVVTDSPMSLLGLFNPSMEWGGFYRPVPCMGLHACVKEHEPWAAPRPLPIVLPSLVCTAVHNSNSIINLRYKAPCSPSNAQPPSPLPVSMPHFLGPTSSQTVLLCCASHPLDASIQWQSPEDQPYPSFPCEGRSLTVHRDCNSAISAPSMFLLLGSLQ
jgi:hypothetical protein